MHAAVFFPVLLLRCARQEFFGTAHFGKPTFRLLPLYLLLTLLTVDSEEDRVCVCVCVYYIYNEIRVCPRLGAARADPPLSRMYPQGQCCLGANLAGATLLTED